MLKQTEKFGEAGIYHRYFLTKKAYYEMVELQNRGILRFQRLALVLEGTLHYLPVQTFFSRPGVGRTMGWKEKECLPGRASGEQGFFHWEFFMRTEKKGVVSDDYRNSIMDITPLKQSRCVSRQGSSGMNTNPIPCRMSCNTGVSIMCVGLGRQTLVKDKTANDNYYLFDAGSTGTGDSKAKGERTAKVVLAAGLPLPGLEGKQKFKEYLFREGTANPFLI